MHRLMAHGRNSRQNSVAHDSPTKRQKGDIHSEAADSNGIAGLETAVAALPPCEGDAGAAGSPHESDAESETIVAASGAS